MKVVGVIPARWGATRLPGKSLVSICGKPLIQWVIENAAKAERLEELLVATDDRRIAEVVEGLGARAVMTRSDHPSGTDRVAEAVEDLAAEVVVNIQGDEPFVAPALIDRLAGALLAGEGWDMATAAARLNEPADIDAPSVVKVVFAADGRALYFSRYPIPFVRDGNGGEEKGLHWRHIGVYAYTKAFLGKLVKAPPCDLEKAEKLEQLRALHLGGRILTIETEDTGTGVDTPDDVKRAEARLQARLGKTEEI